jgi:hippurate hydrolase
MGGEDFAFYLEHAPGCYVRFGARRSNPQAGPAHSSRFDIDESVLAVGARYYFEVAVEGVG